MTTPNRQTNDPEYDRVRLHAAALVLIDYGWPVFPLQPGGKAPAVRDWERRATTDPDAVNRCWNWERTWNIGIATGPAGLVVVDLDVPKPDPAGAAAAARCGADVLADLASQEGESVPPTFTVRTPSGGRHLYYAAPAGARLRNTAGRLGPLIDTRAHGGYVVAPCSVVNERMYVVERADPPAPLPPWLARRLTVGHGDVGTAPRPTLAAVLSRAARLRGYLGAAVRGEVDRVLTARPGGRNHALNAAAYSLGQLTGPGLLDEQLAVDALTAAALDIGLTPTETALTIRSGLRAGARNPRKVPA